MADLIRQPTPANYEYGMFKTLPATRGTAGVDDTFFGKRNKAYVDFHCRNMTRVRGHNFYYYVLESQNRRIDGDRPLGNNLDEGRVTKPESDQPTDFARHRHAGMGLYGENVVIGKRIDSVRREFIPDWPFLDPILVRGCIYDLEHEQEPDERGSIYVRRCSIDLARVHCDREWDFQPRIGDVVRLPRLNDLYMDIEDVQRDESRWGNTGFFAIYKLILVKMSKYEPQRKIAERKQTPEGSPPPQTGDPNPGSLS